LQRLNNKCIDRINLISFIYRGINMYFACNYNLFLKVILFICKTGINSNFWAIKPNRTENMKFTSKQ